MTNEAYLEVQAALQALDVAKLGLINHPDNADLAAAYDGYVAADERVDAAIEAVDDQGDEPGDETPADPENG